MAATERRASGDPGRVGGGESEGDEEKETERDRKRESKRGWRGEEEGSVKRVYLGGGRRPG